MERRWPEVEHRFLVEAVEAHRFLESLRPHLPIYVRDPELPVEYVRTTYYDTDDLTLFHSEQRGRARRVRIRQYAYAPNHRTPPRLGHDCAFEVKECCPEGRAKARVVGSPDDIAGIVRGRDHSMVSRPGSVPPLLAYAAQAIELRLLRPRLTTWFQRLTHACPGARITVDQQIEFAHPAPLGMPGELAAPRTVVGRGPPLVLEIKLRNEPEEWLTSAMRRLFLATEFSKFRDGLLAVQRAGRA